MIRQKKPSEYSKFVLLEPVFLPIRSAVNDKDDLE